jgi:single-strand DNA-binding protein
MLNNITLQGRLTRDPEMRYTQSEIPVCRFSLAVERDVADKATGRREVDFIDCVAWRGTAEFMSKYFQKGNSCLVSGRLQIRNWQDNDGSNHKTAEVVVNNVYFCERKTETKAAFEEMAGDDEELPF